MPKAIVNRRGRERVLLGHHWIFRSDVRKAEADSGDIVDVLDPGGGLLGRAFYSAESEIQLRLITAEDQVVDEPFWRSKLISALALRERLFPTSALYRWVHGESDGIPSVIIDRYGEFLSIQTLSRGSERLKDLFVRLAVDLLSPRGIVERNDQKVRSLEGLPLVKSKLYGEIPTEVNVQEGNVAHRPDLWNGQKTGLFLDQRENHAAARGYAAGRALDVFSYDGGFALQLASVCESVLAIDSSAEALARLRANAERQGWQHVETVEANAFDVLRELAQRGEAFDTIVLDPPAFAKNRAAVPKARRGYKEINLRALKLLRPGGHLVTCTCSYHLREGDFLDIVQSAAADVRARLVVVEKRTQARDHPILLAMPETYYLKCLILRKL